MISHLLLSVVCIPSNCILFFKQVYMYVQVIQEIYLITECSLFQPVFLGMICPYCRETVMHTGILFMLLHVKVCLWKSNQHHWWYSCCSSSTCPAQLQCGLSCWESPRETPWDFPLQGKSQEKTLGFSPVLVGVNINGPGLVIPSTTTLSTSLPFMRKLLRRGCKVCQNTT